MNGCNSKHDNLRFFNSATSSDTFKNRRRWSAFVQQWEFWCFIYAAIIIARVSRKTLNCFGLVLSPGFVYLQICRKNKEKLSFYSISENLCCKSKWKMLRSYSKNIFLLSYQYQRVSEENQDLLLSYSEQLRENFEKNIIFCWKPQQCFPRPKLWNEERSLKLRKYYEKLSVSRTEHTNSKHFSLWEWAFLYWCNDFFSTKREYPNSSVVWVVWRTIM